MPGVKPYLAITLTSYSNFLRKGKDYYEKEEDDDDDNEEEEEREREWLKKIEKPITSEADKTLKKNKRKLYVMFPTPQ